MYVVVLVYHRISSLCVFLNSATTVTEHALIWNRTAPPGGFIAETTKWKQCINLLICHFSCIWFEVESFVVVCLVEALVVKPMSGSQNNTFLATHYILFTHDTITCSILSSVQ